VRGAMDPCPYCGLAGSPGPPLARCAVCGMAIARDHRPHLIRVAAEEAPSHLCSVACMENFELRREEAEDG